MVSTIITSAIGIIAGTGTTVSFLPQVIKIIKTQNTKELSPYMFIIHITGVISWIIYGILERNYIICTFNGITLILCMIISYYLLINYLYTDDILPTTVDYA
jgi:MtN3 and saliva related transmembrane protein